MIIVNLRHFKLIDCDFLCWAGAAAGARPELSRRGAGGVLHLRHLTAGERGGRQHCPILLPRLAPW